MAPSSGAACLQLACLALASLAALASGCPALPSALVGLPALVSDQGSALRALPG
jgi:hypothetical protein